MEMFEDPPHGQLSGYREQASFCWKKLRIALEGEENLRLKLQLWKMFEEDPIFSHPVDDISIDHLRKLTFRKIKTLQKKFPLPSDYLIQQPELVHAYVMALCFYDYSLTAKYMTMLLMPQSALQSLGTKKHKKYIQQLKELQILGCYALTEIAHGSNTKAMMTTATYDSKAQQYILHTSCLEAAKCWSGCLGQTATHSIVFAQLVTPDGGKHGLHPFFVPIRDLRTRLPYPGVTIGDMGPKIGLNGVDNGFMMFNQYAVSSESLLNRLGDVSPDGQYIPAFQNPSEMFGASLTQLLEGRIHMTGCSVAIHTAALCIAIRYSAVRRQFSAPGEKESPVLEYQLQQWRLLPHLSCCLAAKVSLRSVLQDYTVFKRASHNKNLPAHVLASMGSEMHAMSCGIKAVVCRQSQRGIQECREACGGHGFLASAQIGEARNANDSCITMEGDGNVLLMQTSRYLMATWQKKDRIELQFGYADFFNRHQQISKTVGSVQQIHQGDLIQAGISALEWVVVYLILQSKGKVEDKVENGSNISTAASDTQVFHLNLLSQVFTKLCMLRKFNDFCAGPTLGAAEGQVMSMVCSMFSMLCVHQHLAVLYQGGYCIGEDYGKAVENSLLQLCERLKPECVRIVDAMAPPDFILNSTLGKSDGEVYKNIYSSMLNFPGVMSRPGWWKEYLPKSHL